MKSFLNISEEILRVIDKNLNLKWLFHNFYLIYLWFLPVLRKNTLLEDSASFMQQFFLFRGGGAPLDAPGLIKLKLRELSEFTKVGGLHRLILSKTLMTVYYVLKFS